MLCTTKLEPIITPLRHHLALAVAADERGDVRTAISEYANACEQALVQFRQNKQLQLIKQIAEWLSRAETLKSRLAARPSRLQFTDIVGMDRVKQALEEAVVLPQLHPQLFQGSRKPWRSILLFGPPGTGKTAIASQLAKESNAEFIAISSSDIISKTFGSSEKAVKDLFARARASLSPLCVVFFDEIDSIGRSRSDDESARRVLTELLAQMDGVGKTSNSRVLVMASTNVPHQLDAALRRRFELKLYIALPRERERALLLAKALGRPGEAHLLCPGDVAWLAKHTADYSGADLRTLAQTTLMAPVRRCLRATHFAPTLDGGLAPCSAGAWNAQKMSLLSPDFPASKLRVPFASLADAKAALEESKPSMSKADLEALERFEAEFGYQSAATTTTTMPDILADIATEWGPEPSSLVQTLGSLVQRGVALLLGAS